MCARLHGSGALLQLLEPQRIGHGTRSAEDPRLVEHLCSTGTHLELCPSSNLQIIPSLAAWADHPVDRLYRAGVSLSVNTDTRMLTPATLTGEYQGLQRTFGWGAEDFLRVNLMGIAAAFASDAVKARVSARLADGTI